MKLLLSCPGAQNATWGHLREEKGVRPLQGRGLPVWPSIELADLVTLSSRELDLVYPRPIWIQGSIQGRAEQPTFVTRFPERGHACPGRMGVEGSGSGEGARPSVHCARGPPGKAPHPPDPMCPGFPSCVACSWWESEGEGREWRRTGSRGWLALEEAKGSQETSWAPQVAGAVCRRWLPAGPPGSPGSPPCFKTPARAQIQTEPYIYTYDVYHNHKLS